jgi:ubiquinone biosynthesis protein UbiJ
LIESLIENVLNRGLPRSVRAQQLCRELEGKRVGVSVTGFGRWLVESTGVSLKISRAVASGREDVKGVAATGGGESASAGTSADAEISGGIVSLLALAGPNAKEVLQRGDARITGDAEQAERFQELGRLLRPDLEEELSLFIGDVPAHQIGRFARAAQSWTGRVAVTATRNAAEYFAHEKRDLVPRAEGDQFLKGVDALREDVDRLEARIEHLSSRETSR